MSDLGKDLIVVASLNRSRLFNYITRGNMKLKLLGILIFTSMLNTCLADDSLKNKDHEGASKSRVLVQEFFYFGCPHCKKLQGPLKNWLSKVDATEVEYEKVPVDFGRTSQLVAKHYYVAKYLNRDKDFSTRYFNAIITKRIKASDDLATKILVHLGEKKEVVVKLMTSPEVLEEVERAKQLTLKYKIQSLPAFVIGGQHKLDKSNLIENETILEAVERVIKTK